MAGNNIYVQGSYVDIHDNEVVNLSVERRRCVWATISCSTSKVMCPR